MNSSMTSKPYSIPVEDGMSRPSFKSLLQNCLQRLFPEKPTKDAPWGIHSFIVDAILVVRLSGTA